MYHGGGMLLGIPEFVGSTPEGTMLGGDFVVEGRMSVSYTHLTLPTKA